MFQLRVCSVIVLTTMSLGVAQTAHGALTLTERTVFTEFPEPQEIGPEGLVVGEGRPNARLFGGSIEVRGVLAAYASPPFAWVFDEGESGQVRFSNFPTRIRFFSNVVVARDSENEVNGDASFSLVGIFGGRFVPVVIFSESFDGESSISFDLDGQDVPLQPGATNELVPLSLVRHMQLNHTATGDSFFAVDDFGFDAFVLTFGR
ncbi:MAG: hypothetical protein MPJ50_19540 [Pirellulales bacterium]|nr:hypothetical protein [Pirellulales bacterium]